MRPPTSGADGRGCRPSRLPPRPPPPQPRPGTPDLTAQLMQLGQLKDQGVLSEEEFQAAKAKLLSA